VILALLDEAPAHCSIDELEHDIGDPLRTADGITGLHRFGLVHSSCDGRFWFASRTARYLARLDPGSPIRGTLHALLDADDAQLTLAELQESVGDVHAVLESLDELERFGALHRHEDRFWLTRPARRFQALLGQGAAA
jgi:hypothetical protein